MKRLFSHSIRIGVALQAAGQCFRMSAVCGGRSVLGLLGLAALVAWAGAVSAQVPPQLLHYQGLVADNNGNFNGPGQFKFALVSGDGAVSYWSNDGQSGANLEPTAHVPLNVDHGVFSVLLGDTGTVIPYATFDHPDVRLRVWFRPANNNGPFQQFTPDQRIVSVGYAMMSANVPAGAITTDKLAASAVTGDKLANGTIGPVQLADGSVTEPKIAAGAVTATKIAQPALHTAHLGDGIVLTAKIGDGAVTAAKLAAGAVGTGHIANNAITGAKIADGTITGADLADNTITSGELANVITLQTLNLGSINWDGTLNVYAQPAGGGGIGTPTGDLRARLSGLSDNGVLELFGNTGFPALRAYATTDGGALRLEDDSGSASVTMGAFQAGGYLNVYRPGGNYGVNLSGGGPTDPGGEIILYHDSASGSRIGVFLDGAGTAGGGEAFLRDIGGTNRIRMSASTSTGQGALLQMMNGLGDTTVSIDADASGRASALSLFNGTNTASVLLDGNSGGAGLIELKNNRGATRAELDGQGASGGGELILRDEDGTATVQIEAAEGVGNGAQIALYKAAGGNASIVLDADFGGEGRITTQVLEITGGSDLSENFDIQSPHAEPGMIVRIDSAHPGELAVSDRAYDRTVAGVVSGAGGVKPGMLMGQRNSKADGKHPVALTGRVYCFVDASHGAIEPGDLITTSDTPGHGMKVTDYARAQGAIIGKAMTPLAAGRGLVLVLVSLQ